MSQEVKRGLGGVAGWLCCVSLPRAQPGWVRAQALAGWSAQLAAQRPRKGRQRAPSLTATVLSPSLRCGLRHQPGQAWHARPRGSALVSRKPP